MKNTFRAAYPIILGALLISSCSVAGRRYGNPDDIDPRTAAENEFNPLAYDEDREIITTGVNPAREPDVNKSEPLLPARAPQTHRADEYFSVQVFASKSSSAVNEFRDSIKSQFSDEIKIDYQAPYYRVCVGKVIGYENGEQLLQRVIAMGFPKAWLVKLRE